MDCREAKDFVEDYADGQLDLSDSLEIERHLAGCGGCAAALSRLVMMR